jgi:CRISPR/Cas system-associated endonuclease Cas3-HD
MNVVRIGASVLAALVLSACTDRLHDRNSIAIDVIPIKHTHSFSVKQSDDAKIEAEKFINDNWETIASIDLELVVLSAEGIEISTHVKNVLKSKGKDPKQVTESIEIMDDLQFDFQLISTRHEVVTPICEYYQIERFGEVSQGCFVESARWKSMVSPDAMLKK